MAKDEVLREKFVEFWKDTVYFLLLDANTLIKDPKVSTIRFRGHNIASANQVDPGDMHLWIGLNGNGRHPELDDIAEFLVNRYHKAVLYAFWNYAMSEFNGLVDSVIINAPSSNVYRAGIIIRAIEGNAEEQLYAFYLDETE